MTGRIAIVMGMSDKSAVSRPSKARRSKEPADPNAPGCEWPGCDSQAAHRAPRSRNELRAYRWFCLDHVRAYNASWNYYAGMSDAEIEADLRQDTVWQRPSWPLAGGRFGRTPDFIADDFGVFEGAAGSQSVPPPPPPSAPHLEALSVLDLQPPLTAATVKARYKQLVKIHHPDANGGDKAAEERFKRITVAYQLIMEELAS